MLGKPSLEKVKVGQKRVWPVRTEGRCEVRAGGCHLWLWSACYLNGRGKKPMLYLAENWMFRRFFQELLCFMTGEKEVGNLRV